MSDWSDYRFAAPPLSHLSRVLEGCRLRVLIPAGGVGHSLITLPDLQLLRRPSRGGCPLPTRREPLPEISRAWGRSPACSGWDIFGQKRAKPGFPHNRYLRESADSCGGFNPTCDMLEAQCVRNFPPSFSRASKNSTCCTHQGTGLWREGAPPPCRPLSSPFPDLSPPTCLCAGRKNRQRKTLLKFTVREGLLKVGFRHGTWFAHVKSIWVKMHYMPMTHYLLMRV